MKKDEKMFGNVLEYPLPVSGGGHVHQPLSCRHNLRLFHSKLTGEAVVGAVVVCVEGFYGDHWGDKLAGGGYEEVLSDDSIFFRISLEEILRAV